MNNIKGFKAIAKSKKVSELFLGTLEISWDFAKIGYTAVCTEALPLTFAEKMICGIANLEGKICLGEIAHIMGLNIENNVQNLKFQDKGETEILFETLQCLKRYGVISSPDDSFSYVELTDIGKEYYTMGRKFKQGETKGFTMYFDLIAGQHSKAKTLFSKLTVDGSKEYPEDIELPYAEENFVKKYAESQIPQYYSEKTGNSFTEMSVASREFLYKTVILGIIYDSNTETYRFEVINNGGISTEYIADYVNSKDNQTHYLELFLSKQSMVSVSKSDSQIKFEEKIAKVQSDAEYAIYNNKPELALQIVEEYAKSPEYVEKQSLFDLIKSNKKKDCTNEVFISLPMLTNDIEEEIRLLAKDDNIRIMLSCGNIEDFDSRFGDNVLSLNGNEGSDILLILGDVTYCCENLIFNIENINFSIDFLHKQEENSRDTLEKIRKLFAMQFIPYELDNYDKLLHDTDTKEIVDRIDELNTVDELITFPESYVKSTGYEMRLVSLRKHRDNLLFELVQKYSSNLMKEFDSLRTKISIEDIKTLEDIEKTKKDLFELKKKLIPEQDRADKRGLGNIGITLDLNDSISTFESQLNNREIFLRQELLQKSYIIDTNVFVYFPEIMDYIENGDRTILSLKVLEELDKLKVTLDGKNKRNVKKAIKEINYKIRMKSKTFRMEAADTRLLPIDFDKKNPDNMILSVALKYRDRNPFLITNDINFQNRAAAMGIPFKGLADILPKDVYQSIDFSKSEKEKDAKNVQNQGAQTEKSSMPKSLSLIMRKAYKKCEDESDEVLVAKFVSAIKNIMPDFEPSSFGFLKFKDLCVAYPSDIELYNNTNSALCIRLKHPDSDGVGKFQNDNIKDIDSLSREQQSMLKDLLLKMIAAEDSSNPTKDGEIRKTFIHMSGININLAPVKQMRELLDIPSAKQRKRD
jgi:rRNA-processing protein FCF1/molybdopterin converting factor small subunit